MKHIVILVLSALFIHIDCCKAAEPDEPILVWPGKAPDEPSWITQKKAEAVTGSDNVIRIPYVDTPELLRFPVTKSKSAGACVISTYSFVSFLLYYNKLIE